MSKQKKVATDGSSKLVVMGFRNTSPDPVGFAFKAQSQKLKAKSFKVGSYKRCALSFVLTADVNTAPGI